MRAPAPGADLAHDAARDVVAGQEIRGPPGVAVALRVAESLLLAVRRLGAVVLGDVVEHEPPAVLVAEDSAFAADAFGHEDALHAQRPHHARRMELDELHVHQVRARLERERVTVAGVLPAVAGDLERAADAAGREHDRARVEDPEPALLAVVGERARDPGRRP